MDGVPMQLQSSYILLPNPYNKKPSHWEDEKGVLHIEIGHSVYNYVKKAFPNMTTKEIDGVLFQYRYSFPVELEGTTTNIIIVSKNVRDSYYIDVAAEGKTTAQLIAALEYVHNTLFATEIDEDYISIVSYDAVSEYYCNKLYPKLNKLERNLRKLLFNIYVLNFGKEYFQATTTKEMQDKAKKIIQAKGGTEKRETQYIKQYFYSLEYADIQVLFFEKARPLILVEGPGDVNYIRRAIDLLSENNEAYNCLKSADIIHCGGASNIQRTIDELKENFPDGKKVIALYDRDDAGGTELKKAIGKGKDKNDSNTYRVGQVYYLKLPKVPRFGAPEFVIEDYFSKDYKKSVAQSFLDNSGEGFNSFPKDLKQKVKDKLGEDLGSYDENTMRGFSVLLDKFCRILTGREAVIEVNR